MGLIHYYYGYGKGKTCAALGLALRARGHGLSVVLARFLKARPSGEIDGLKKLGVTVLDGQTCERFARDMSDGEKADTKRLHDDALKKALALVSEGRCDVLVLDEAADAYLLGLLDADMLERLIKNKPDALELVITGHEPVEFILERADYVTEMTSRKHPYDSGVTARRGIEY